MLFHANGFASHHGREIRKNGYNVRVSRLKLPCLMHAALQRVSPGADSVTDFPGVDRGADDVCGEEEIAVFTA